MFILQASVPLEFRKWAKWYLVRHFAKKEAPVFCKNGHHDFKGRTCQFSKKNWKKSCKMETLTVSHFVLDVRDVLRLVFGLEMCSMKL